jgi:hypothetical protein
MSYIKNDDNRDIYDLVSAITGIEKDDVKKRGSFTPITDVDDLTRRGYSYADAVRIIAAIELGRRVYVADKQIID